MEGSCPRPASRPELTIRLRQHTDVARCVGVHAADGYPLRWPADSPAWLTPMNLLSAWIAED
jgi:hypothetical protein